MIFISISKLSECVQLSERTITSRIKELKEEKKFTKQYPGRSYTLQEAQNIIDLLGIPVDINKAFNGK